MKIIKNTIIIGAGAISYQAIGYFSNLYAAHKLGPSEYGTLTALLAFMNLSMIIFGPFSSLITKYISLLHSNQGNEKVNSIINKIYSDYKKILLFTLLFFLIFSQNISEFLKIFSVTSVILTGIIIVVNGFFTIHLGILSGSRKFARMTWLRNIDATLRSLIIFGLLYLGFQRDAVLLSYVLSLIIVSIGASTYFKGLNIRNQDDILEIKRSSIYSMGLKFFISGLVIHAIFNLPSIYIQHYYSNEINGYWNAGLNLSRIIFVFSESICQVLYPELVSADNHKNKRKLVFKGLALILLITITSSIVFFLFSEIIIDLIYGKQYQNAATYLKWQGFFIIFVSLIQYFFTILFSRK